MYINIETARAMVRRSARRLSDPKWRDEEAMALSMAAKVFATESAIKTVDLAMEVCGGGAFFKRSPLERLYRDVRAGTFHPLGRWDALEMIGKSELKIPQRSEPRFR
jgi:acyl-CoA dehydrogenase